MRIAIAIIALLGMALIIILIAPGATEVMGFRRHIIDVTVINGFISSIFIILAVFLIRKTSWKQAGQYTLFCLIIILNFSYFAHIPIYLNSEIPTFLGNRSFIFLHTAILAFFFLITVLYYTEST